MTATCRESDRLNIMTDLCMNEAAHVQCSADRPNIFLDVRVMPGNIEQWSPILDVKILQTLGIKSDRKVFFSVNLLRWPAACTSIMKMYLESLCTMIPVVAQCLLTVLSQCTIQSQPHPSRMQSAHLCQTPVELCDKCLLHNPLVWAFTA